MASSPAMTSSTNSSSSNSSCGGNKRKLCAPDGLPGAMRESNNDGNDHFFQPHLKSQVTQKLVNRQSDDVMRRVCQQTLDRLRNGASEYYKGLGHMASPSKEDNNNNANNIRNAEHGAMKTTSLDQKPTKRELLKPSIAFDVNSNETRSGDFRCCNLDPNATHCYYCSVLICTVTAPRSTDNPCGVQCKLCKQFFCHKCRCESLCLGCS